MSLEALLAGWKAEGRLKQVSTPLSPELEAAKALKDAEPEPVILEDVAGARVLGNIMPSRDSLARGLGVDPARFLEELRNIVDGKTVRDGAGLVRSSATYGESELPKGDWGKIPILKFYEGDGGPFLTSGVWTVQDPETGRNLSYHRMMMSSPSRGTVRVVERRGTDTALKKAGGKAEAAICIGPSVSVLFAAALSPAPEVDETELAARFGRIELQRCKTVDLEVPADSQLVIEGRFTGETGPEGPFVDITGTVDIVRQQPVFEITRISGKRDPLHYTILPAGMDHKTLMGVPKELDMYREIGKACRCLDVRVTPGGSNWLHAVVRIRKAAAGDGRRALEGAFQAHRSLKHCVVVDEDIDISDPLAVEWAVATRAQADKDVIILKDQASSSLDPSARHAEGEGSVGAKLGIDATIPEGADPALFARSAAG